MKFAFSVLVLLLAIAPSSFGQDNGADLKTTELISPIFERVENGRQSLDRYCFNFVTERFSGGQDADICYGGLRAGNAWDWFQVMGVGFRNNLKNLGKHQWGDDFKVAVVKPYPKLKPGETRSIVVDTSGRGGNWPRPQPVPMSNDRNLATRDFDDLEALSSLPERNKKTSDYKAHFEAERGKMYALRVVNDSNDFYVLFRVDELERGKRCKISWKRIDAPQED